MVVPGFAVPVTLVTKRDYLGNSIEYLNGTKVEVRGKHTWTPSAAIIKSFLSFSPLLRHITPLSMSVCEVTSESNQSFAGGPYSSPNSVDGSSAMRRNSLWRSVRWSR